MNAKKEVLILLLLGVATLAWISRVTTFKQFSGFYPPGVYRVQLVDSKGDAVNDAYIRIYEAETARVIFAGDLEPTTEPSISQVVIQDHLGGLAGSSWHLFWVLPIADVQGRLECRITAPGFMPNLVPMEALMANMKPLADPESFGLSRGLSFSSSHQLERQ